MWICQGPPLMDFDAVFQLPKVIAQKAHMEPIWTNLAKKRKFGRILKISDEIVIWRSFVVVPCEASGV